jgi:DNA (cytosine-5)-methyltransferase 1
MAADVLSVDPPTAVDLFCGGGGLSLGLRRAGFRTLAAFDMFGAAVKTYRRNLGDHISDAEIHEEIELPRTTIIAGGPPCQGFSSAGQRRPGDRRNTLVSVFASLIARYRPAAFIFENVEGFLTAEGGDRVFDLLKPLIAAGYRIHLRKVNAANYGVPQHRKRVIGIGGLGWDPTFPVPTHRAHGAPGAERIGLALPPSPSILHALHGLPPPAVSSPGAPQGHFASPLDDGDLSRVRMLRPGQTMRDLPEEMWHPSYRRRAFRRVQDGTPTERRGGAPCGIRRLIGAEPSKTITSGARAEFVHPTEDRYLTLRECARIQTFPDDFEFLGSQADQSLVVGNAVPVTLAEAIGRTLLGDLAKASVGRKKGALLSFVPTVASGMSPALQAITTRVQRAFNEELPVGGL